MLKNIKIKIQLKVLKYVKRLYEKQLSKAKENYNVFKNFKNESPRKIEEGNIEYFTMIIMTLSCIIDDIQYDLLG